MNDFVILRGWHRSDLFRWVPFFSKKISFRTVFNGSIFHDNPLGYVHKLIGFSDGCFNHHKNSFRIGWNAEGKNRFVNVYIYTYVDGVRNIYPLLDIIPGKELEVTVSLHKGFYRVIVGKDILEYPRSLKIKNNYKNLLYPYFGGKEKSPHNMWFPVSWKFFKK